MRSALVRTERGTHPLLTLDVLVGSPREEAFDAAATGAIFDRLGKLRLDTATIAGCAALWETDLSDSGFSLLEFRTRDLVFLGQANPCVLTSSLRLHPVIGVPVITGESFKGLVRDCLGRAVLSDGTPAYTKDQISTLVGSAASADSGAVTKPGLIEFADAIWIGGVSAGTGFAGREVITAHSAEYHNKQGEGHRPGSTAIKPSVFSLLGARGCFLGGVRCATPSDSTSNDEKVLAAAITVLRRACEEIGIGAGTRTDLLGRLQVEEIEKHHG